MLRSSPLERVAGLLWMTGTIALSLRRRIAFPSSLPVIPFPPPQSARIQSCSGHLGKSLQCGRNVASLIPSGDIAVLGPPDNQVLCVESEDYEALTEAAVPLSIWRKSTDACATSRALATMSGCTLVRDQKCAS